MGDLLRGGDAADEVFLLGVGFGADGEGVEEIEPESEIEGFVLAVAQLSLAQDFHANDAFAGGAHFTNDADDGIRIGIHEGADGIDTNEMDFDPGRFCGSAERFDAVARAAVSTNNALFLGFRENIHDAFVALGPIAFGEAVHEANVNVIGGEFASETVEIFASSGGIAGPRFSEHSDFVARDMLEGFGNVRMAAIGISGVEEAQAVIVAVEEQVGKALDAEGSLVGMMTTANGACAHGEPAGLDARLAEGHGVGSAEFARESGKGEVGPGKGGRVDPSRTGGAGRAVDEIAAFHAASC